MLLVLGVTLVPIGASDTALDLRCLPCGDHGTADFIANIFLFAPFGAAATRFRRPLICILLGFALSVCVESAQWIGSIPGRHVTLADVVANTLGTGVGVMFAALAGRVASVSRRGARVGMLVYAGALLLLLTAGRYLLSRPQTPDTDLPQPSAIAYTTGYGWFERVVAGGTVDGVRFDNRAGGALRVVSPVRDAHEVSVRVRGRDRRDGFVPLLFVHARDDSVAHLMLAQRGNKYALRIHVRAEKFGLRLPDLELTDPASVVDTIGVEPVERIITSTVADTRLALDVATSAGDRSSVSERITPLHAWMLVVPLDSMNSLLAHTGTVVFGLCLLVPLVLLGWRAMRNV